MKSFLQVIIIAFIFISFLLYLPNLTKERNFKNYSDEELRLTASAKGLKPIPKTYEELLELSNDKNDIKRKAIIITCKKDFIFFLFC